MYMDKVQRIINDWPQQCGCGINNDVFGKIFKIILIPLISQFILSLIGQEINSKAWGNSVCIIQLFIHSISLSHVHLEQMTLPVGQFLNPSG